VIALPSDCLQLGEFVKAIASVGVTTFKSPLDKSPPPFIDIASRHANQVFFEIMDKSPPPFIDIASRHANHVFFEIINEGIKNAILIECCLEDLHQKDPEFTYKFAIALDRCRCGYVWMTPAMGRSFELYSDVLFCDMMKGKIGSQEWPYVGPVNSHKKIEVATKGILVTESLDACDFVVTAILKMALKRKKENGKVI
jgi:hypothetical protein